jgi:hypothetical protein
VYITTPLDLAPKWNSTSAFPTADSSKSIPTATSATNSTSNFKNSARLSVQEATKKTAEWSDKGNLPFPPFWRSLLPFGSHIFPTKEASILPVMNPFTVKS